MKCEIYLRGNQSILTFASEDALEVVHYDICGPFEVISLGRRIG